MTEETKDLIAEARLLADQYSGPGTHRHVTMIDRLADALEAIQRDVTEACREELHSWDYFTSQQVDPYWMRCNKLGKHDEHKNSDTGARWPVVSQKAGAVRALEDAAIDEGPMAASDRRWLLNRADKIRSED